MKLLWIMGLACLAAADDSVDLFQQPKRDSPKRLCGSNLADTLSLVCNGVYNHRYSKKDAPFDGMAVGDYAYDSDYSGWPMLTREEASALSGGLHRRFRRGRHGVYDECCLKPCSLDEMRTYCGQ